MNIRPFDPATDWRSVMYIERQCFPEEPWTRENYEEAMTDDGAQCLVAVEDGITWGCCWFQGREILSLGVKESQRGRGTGELLLREVLDLLRAGADRYCELQVRPSAVPAIKLYERLGFRVYAYDAHYYATGEPGALLMRLDLHPDLL